MKNGFDIAFKITWSIVGLCLIAFAIMLYQYLFVENVTADWDYLVFAVPLFIFCIVFIAILYSTRKTYETGQKEIQQGNYLTHWTYEEEEWSLFNKKEWKRSRNRAIYIPFGCWAFFMFLSLGDDEFRQDVLPIAGPWITCFFVLLSILLLFYTRFLYKRTLTCPREVKIGLHGISYGGYYTMWSGTGTKLGNIKIIQGDPSLIDFEVKNWGRYGYNSRHMKIMIPRGREKEAEEVITKLTPI
jgi:hypothetical protein